MKLKLLSLLTALAIAFAGAFGLTACKQPVSVKSFEINADGELIVIMTDGTKTNLGKVKGEDGKDGVDGTGIVSASIDGKGNLILELTGGKTLNLGKVKGADGNDGVDGKGVSTAYIDGDGNLILGLTDGTELNCGKVLSPSVADYGFYFAKVEDNGELKGYEITGLNNEGLSYVSVPSEVNGVSVVGIGEGAFAGYENLVKVEIPDSVKTIGARAFADCAKLKYVTLGSGIAEIGEFAFARCENLDKVNITDLAGWCGISFAAPSANPLYYAHKLYVNDVLAGRLDIPSSVTGIGGFAFYSCENITALDADGVGSIGESAFYGCKALESVNLVNAEAVGEMAFADCTALKNLNLGGKLKSIGGFAFNRCKSLNAVNLPSSVEAVGENAFAECASLKDLTLNEGLKAIGDGAFCGCPMLEKFLMPDSVTSIGFGVLMNSEGGFVDGSENIGGVKEIRISDSLTEIPDFAFSKCSFKTVELGSSVKKVNYSSFFGCAALESVVVPESVKHIASYSFYKCPALQSIFYKGTAEQWDKVFIGSKGNDNLKGARVYYYSPAKPAAGEFFWRYVDGVPTPWQN